MSGAFGARTFPLSAALQSWFCWFLARHVISDRMLDMPSFIVGDIGPRFIPLFSREPPCCFCRLWF